MAPDAPLRSEPEAVADIGSREKLSFGGDGICAGSIRGDGSLLGRLFVMVIPPRLGDRSESWPESETIDLLTRIPCGGRPVERAPRPVSTLPRAEPEGPEPRAFGPCASNAPRLHA